jgi:hypothetical protein
MKKLTISLTLAALALVPSVQAGQGKDSAKSKTSGADKVKTGECTATAKLASTDKNKSAETACATACCEKNNLTKKTVKPAEKGGMLLARR